MELKEILTKKKVISEMGLYVYFDTLSKLYYGSSKIIDTRMSEEVPVNVLVKTHEDETTEYYSLDSTLKIITNSNILKNEIFEIAQMQV